jgi:hypothetical protein
MPQNRETPADKQPEVPGEDTFTHGGSGEPPSVDPEVQKLLESGKELYVDGQNQLREVEPKRER